MPKTLYPPASKSLYGLLIVEIHSCLHTMLETSDKTDIGAETAAVHVAPGTVVELLDEDAIVGIVESSDGQYVRVRTDQGLLELPSSLFCPL
jgi:hypothetical protein